MSVKTASPDHPIAPMIAERWSPRAFSDRKITPEDRLSLFEAARWSASGGNGQPWFFVFSTPDDADAHDRMASCLSPGNAWAKKAPLLVISVTRLDFEHNGRPNRHAYYDLGLAVANLTYQAESMGLAVHQMAGFDPEKARQLLEIPERCDAVTAIAVGYLGDPATLTEDQQVKELAPRTRKPLAQFVFNGKWGNQQA